MGRLGAAGPLWPWRSLAPGQLEPRAGSPALRFCHAQGLQVPRLGPLGPWSPLPTPFGPRHQHKGRGCLGRKAMWSLSPLRGAEGPGDSGIRSCQEGHRSVNQLPQGPSLAPPTARCPTDHSCLSHRPQLTLAGWARVAAPGPDLEANSAPRSRKRGKHHTLKPKAP